MAETLQNRDNRRTDGNAEKPTKHIQEVVDYTSDEVLLIGEFFDLLNQINEREEVC